VLFTYIHTLISLPIIPQLNSGSCVHVIKNDAKLQLCIDCDGAQAKRTKWETKLFPMRTMRTFFWQAMQAMFSTVVKC